MFSIGEFAGWTGLTVKALHHYDEVGLLPPAHVDASTRYRRYAPEQLRTGIAVQALRGSGVPLPEVAGAVAGGAPAQALAAHRARVLAAREAEDARHAAAVAALDALDEPVEVVERDAPEQPWVGVVAFRFDGTPEAGAAAERAMARPAEVHGELVGAGNPPTGEVWNTLRTSGDPEAPVEVVVAFAVAAPVPPGWGGADVETGVLPARRELVARWRGDPDALPEGVVHPAVLAVLERTRSPGPELRQGGLVEDGAVVGAQVAVTVGATLR